MMTTVQSLLFLRYFFIASRVSLFTFSSYFSWSVILCVCVRACVCVCVCVCVEKDVRVWVMG